MGNWIFRFRRVPSWLVLATFLLLRIPLAHPEEKPSPKPESALEEDSSRLIPSPEGFVIRSIVEGSVFGKLGFKNGDVIQTINGKKPDDSPEGIQSAMLSLMSASKVKVEILRKKKKKTLEYTIQ